MKKKTDTIVSKMVEGTSADTYFCFNGTILFPKLSNTGRPVAAGAEKRLYLEAVWEAL